MHGRQCLVVLFANGSRLSSIKWVKGEGRGEGVQRAKTFAHLSVKLSSTRAPDDSDCSSGARQATTLTLREPAASRSICGVCVKVCVCVYVYFLSVPGTLNFNFNEMVKYVTH